MGDRLWPSDSVQVVELKPPVLRENDAVPVGVVLIPESLSLTVAVHRKRFGLRPAVQVTPVVVLRLVTVTVVYPLLVACAESPP